MVNFRQVIISNADNTESIELNDFDGYLMTSPTGFGIYRVSEYITVGNERVSTNNKAVFQKITMNVLILGNRSEWEVKYASLRDFISKNINQGFRLYYTPHEETRYVKCDINIVDKTEKDYASLPIKLEIQPLSLWLADVQKTSVQNEVSTSIFEFAEQEDVEDEYERQVYSANFDAIEDVEDEYERDYYAISFGGANMDSATLLNLGNEATPLILRIHGKAVNPFVKLKDYNTGEVIQTAKFTGLTVPTGYYLEIDGNPTSTHIELVNAETLERIDAESFVDIDSNIYLTLPKGKWDIEITEESEEDECCADILYANKYYGG